VRYELAAADERPLVVLTQVTEVAFEEFHAPTSPSGSFRLAGVRGFAVSRCGLIPDTRHPVADAVIL
jgi:hypothetical protein